MGDFIARIGAGLPLTFVGILAVVVLLAWLAGGVGPWGKRVSFGVPWLIALLVGWALMLYRPDSAQGQGVVVVVTIALTMASFGIPFVWKRTRVRHDV